MADMTEEQLVEGMARVACETESGNVRGRWADESERGKAIWIMEARGVLSYLRVHAEDVCRLLGGVGPEWLDSEEIVGGRLGRELRACLAEMVERMEV